MERTFLKVTTENFEDIDNFYGNLFSKNGYKNDIIGNLIELNMDVNEEVEFSKKQLKLLNEQEAQNSGKKFIFTYGWPDVRLLLYNWNEYKKET